MPSSVMVYMLASCWRETGKPEPNSKNTVTLNSAEGETFRSSEHGGTGWRVRTTPNKLEAARGVPPATCSPIEF